MDAPITSTDTTTAGRNTGAAILPDEGRHSDGPGPEVMDAATLKGDNVVNAGGDDLGKIEAIMLDVTTGRIAYAVLSFGGIFGMGTKLFAIPWSALTLDAAKKRFVLNASKEDLDNAPGFDKDHWPSMADQGWAAAVHTHYHVKPYWNDVRQDTWHGHEVVRDPMVNVEANSAPDLRASATGTMPPKY